MTTGQDTLNRIARIAELATELERLASQGDHAFWLHVDTDLLEEAETHLQEQVDAIRDEQENPK